MEVERSIQNVHLNETELLALIQNAFPNSKRLDTYAILSGGALNTSYRFRIECQDFVLRLYIRDRAHCEMEKKLYALIKNIVSTPHLIYSNEHHPPFAYAIFQYIEGIHLSEITKEKKIALSWELGKVLASIHSFTFSKAGFFDKNLTICKSFEIGSSPYFDEAIRILTQGKQLHTRLGDTLTNEVYNLLQQNQYLFPKVGTNICLTHSDFKPVNLLYKTGKVFVLDWEFAHAGIGILDFAILLRHRKQFPLDIGALAKSYTDSGGTLPDDWIRSALITDFVNILSLLDAVTEQPQLFQQLKDAIYTTITLFKNGAQAELEI